MIRIGINNKNNLVVEFAYDKEIVEIMQKLPSRSFNKKTKYWEIPLIDLPILRDELEHYVKRHNAKIILTEEAKKRYLELVSEGKKIKTLSELSDLDYTPIGLKENVKLYPFQKVSAKYLEESKKALLALDMGVGKFQSINAKLLSENGWIKMEDVKIGDKIFGSDGILHNIIGVYPQGKKKLYEIEFTDGSKTTSGDEHLWAIQSSNHKLKKQGFIVKKLEEFKNDLYWDNENTKWFIPMTKPIQFKERIFDIDPYIFGKLIGDDSKINDSIKITFDGLNVKSHKKFIPDIYKFSSLEQRISIFQGLMDTNGKVNTKNGIVIEYTSTSEKLINDIQFIIESFGGTARMTSHIPSFLFKGKKKKGRRTYRLNINLPPEIKPFRIPRKLNKYITRTKNKPYRGVRSIKYIGEEECQCIAIDSEDHLYITDHCILTHNTICSLAATSSLIQKNIVKKPLIICPASLKFNWAMEIVKFSNYTYTIISGDSKKRQKLYNNDSDFTIVNYDLIRHDISHIHKVPWDLVIADEIQRAKTYTTAISRNIRTIQPEYIFGLTGTPIENDIMDFFTIMRFINPKIFGNNGLYFKNRYCIVDEWGGIQSYNNEKHHEIDRKTGYFMLRRKKRDIIKDLPERTTNFYYINLTETERKIYNNYKKQVQNNIRLDEDLSTNNGNMNVLSQIVFMREICDCINLVEPLEEILSSKLEELKNILIDLPSESKVVLFTEYERMAQIIEDNIPYRSVHLHGAVKNECRFEDEKEKIIKNENKGLEGKELDLKIHESKQLCVCKNCPYYNKKEECHTRKKIIYQFNNEKDIKVFISTNAGKEGLNLQVANIVINYDLSFNPAVNEQRISRIERIGQMSDNILVINLICSNTIEEKMLKTLQEKQDLFDKVIDKTDKAILRKLTIDDMINLL